MKAVIEDLLTAVVSALAAQYKYDGQSRGEQARYQFGAGWRVNQGDTTMVKRRKFLIGAGALATGSSAALGTGATVFSANDRDSTMSVVADANDGVIGFNNTSPGDIVNETGGELEIDFAEHTDAQGVNLGSEFLIGDINSESQPYVNQSAFQVVNQAAGMNVSYTLSYELTGSLNSNGSTLSFYFTESDEDSYQKWVIQEGAEDRTNNAGNPVFEYSQSGDQNDNNALTNHTPGEALLVALKVDTDNSGSDTTEDLSGNLTISAEPSNAN